MSSHWRNDGIAISNYESNREATIPICKHTTRCTHFLFVVPFSISFSHIYFRACTLLPTLSQTIYRFTILVMFPLPMLAVRTEPHSGHLLIQITALRFMFNQLWQRVRERENCKSIIKKSLKTFSARKHLMIGETLNCCGKAAIFVRCTFPQSTIEKKKVWYIRALKHHF